MEENGQVTRCGTPMYGTPMFGDVTTLEGFHATGKCRDISMQNTCYRHAAWDPHAPPLDTAGADRAQRASQPLCDHALTSPTL